MALLEPFALIFRHRRTLIVQSVQELRWRYVGTIFGLAWVALYPLIFLALYATVQILIYQVSRGNLSPMEFSLMMFCGLMTIFGLTEPLLNSGGALIRGKMLLENRIIPGEIVVVRSVLVGFATALLGTSIAVIVGTFLGTAGPYMLLVPVVIGCLFLFVTGLCWIVSVAAIVIRDIQVVLRFLALGLLVVSPIAYTPEMVPSYLRVLLYANPISYFMVPLQSFVVLNRLPPTEFLFGMFALSFTTFIFGYYFFRRLKHAILDLL